MYKIKTLAIIAFSVLFVSSCDHKPSTPNDQNPPAPAASEQSSKSAADPQNPPIPDGSDTIINTSPFLNHYTLKGAAEPDVSHTIHTVFLAFQNAVMRYDGATATSFLSSSSINYYSNVLNAAKLLNNDTEHYNKFESKLPASVKTTARLATTRLSRDFIDKATPEQLYETAFKQGWIGYKSLSSASLERIEIYEKEGKQYILADFIYDGTSKDKRKSRIGFEFENKSWKIDLVPIFIATDLAIDEMIKKKSLDKNDVFKASIEDAQNQYAADNWIDYTNKDDQFSVIFPKSPVEETFDDVHVYTSMHHKYGQFGVKIAPIQLTDSNVSLNKKLMDDAIKSFLVPLNSTKPVCSISKQFDQLKVEGKIFNVIKCDFTIPDKQSQGKGVWVATFDKLYLLFNIARTDQYDDNMAVKFVESFALLNKE